MLERAFAILTTLVGVSIAAFFVVRLAPGDPVVVMGGERGSTPEEYQEAAERLGLTGPLHAQYFEFIRGAVQGELGRSIVSGREVSAELRWRWPASLELGACVTVVSLLVGIPMGVLAAVRRGTVVDRVVVLTSLFGYSMPLFFLGLIAILVFSVLLGVTPVSGRIGIEFDVEPVSGALLLDTLRAAPRAEYGLSAFGSALRHLVLPTLTMAATPIAVLARMTRASMIEVLSEDYIRAAVARGLSPTRVVYVHALRNALIPIITVGGLFFINTAIVGAILTETIFGWPGIGTYVVESVYARDYPVIQASMLMIGGLVITTNLFVDQLYRAADPRLRS